MYSNLETDSKSFNNKTQFPTELDSDRSPEKLNEAPQNAVSVEYYLNLDCVVMDSVCGVALPKREGKKRFDGGKKSDGGKKPDVWAWRASVKDLLCRDAYPAPAQSYDEKIGRECFIIGTNYFDAQPNLNANAVKGLQGLFILDIDHADQDPRGVDAIGREAVEKLPFAFASYRSAGGRGVAVVCAMVPPEGKGKAIEKAYSNRYEGARRFAADVLNIPLNDDDKEKKGICHLDPSCKDAKRGRLMPSGVIVPPDQNGYVIPWDGDVDASPKRAKSTRRKKAAPQSPEMDPLAVWLRDTGRVKNESGGKLFVCCPWQDTHTTDSGESETAYFPAGLNGEPDPGFKCQHAHCSEHGIGDFVDYCREHGYTGADPRGDGKKRNESPRAQARALCTGYRFDTVKREIVGAGGALYDLDTLAAKIARTNPAISLSGAVEAIRTMIVDNPAAQFDGLKERVCSLAKSYDEATDGGAIDRYATRCCFDLYEARRLRLWLYQLCGRALIRGERTDCMLVLSGHAEGTGKTSFFNALSRVLIGHDAAAFRFSGGKDEDICLSQVPIVVIDEVDKVLRKKDVAELKSIITTPSSYERGAYEAGAKHRLNCAVFGATTNDETPIPAGENEARRYWVLTVRESVAFLGMCEAESVMREAAYETKKALDQHAETYDPLKPDGKLWVQTPEEERETATRNQCRKTLDAPTMAIIAGVRALRHKDACKVYPLPLSSWANAFETGRAEIVGGSLSDDWEPPRASAADIARIIKARCPRRNERDKGAQRAGYKYEDIAAAFYPQSMF